MISSNRETEINSLVNQILLLQPKSNQSGFQLNEIWKFLCRKTLTLMRFYKYLYMENVKSVDITPCVFRST